MRDTCDHVAQGNPFFCRQRLQGPGTHITARATGSIYRLRQVSLASIVAANKHRERPQQHLRMLDRSQVVGNQPEASHVLRHRVERCSTPVFIPADYLSTWPSQRPLRPRTARARPEDRDADHRTRRRDSRLSFGPSSNRRLTPARGRCLTAPGRLATRPLPRRPRSTRAGHQRCLPGPAGLPPALNLPEPRRGRRRSRPCHLAVSYRKAGTSGSRERPYPRSPRVRGAGTPPYDTSPSPRRRHRTAGILAFSLLRWRRSVTPRLEPRSSRA